MRATVTYSCVAAREAYVGTTKDWRLGAAARDDGSDPKKFAFADGEGAGSVVVSSDDGCE
jgi:hypothetical protein